MKKKSLIVFITIILSACSQTTGTQVATEELSSPPSTTQLSDKFTSDTLPDQIATQLDNNSYIYQVNLEDFVQDIMLDNGTTQKIYDLTFATTQKKQPQKIVINTKDLNDEGHGIYLYSNDTQLFHPIRITTIPTKKLNLISDNGQLQQVNVNTAVTVMANDENDLSEFIGDTYYLFYNDLGTISLVTRNFTDNSKSITHDYSKMIEYRQTDLHDLSESHYEQSHHDVEFNNDIQTNNDVEFNNDIPNNNITEFKESYFDLIHSMWKNQKDYIESFEDPNIKQSLQTPHSAAIMEATRLEIAYPEDINLIQESLQRVLSND